MKNLKLLLLLCLFAKFATAQTPTWKWATKMGSLLDDYSSSTKVDKQGNVYVCGYWWSSQTLTFGTGKTALKTAKGSGQFDVYLVKYDPNGVPQWLVQGGGSYSDMARSISLDSAGNVYIGGGFNDDLLSFNASSGGTADFYGTGGSAVTITSNDSDDMFVVKVTPSGWVSWGTVLGGPNDEGVNNLSTDWAGNTYVTGYFDTVTTIGSTTLTSNAGYDGFISQIDSAGVVNWAKNFGGKGLESGYGIGVDSSGNSYIAGTFGDTLILGTDTLKSNGARKTLLIKYDIKGNLQWALGAEGNSRSYTYNLDVDKYGNSCLATRFLDTLIFRKNMTISNGSFDIGLSKFDANGKSIWVKSSGGLGNEQVSDIVVDKGGNLIVSGLLIDSLRHGSLLLKTTTTGTLDAFMVAFDSSGKPTWGVKAGGKNIDYATGVTTDNKGNYYFCGDYNRTNSPYSSTGSAVFGSITLSTVGYWDGFLAKVNACVQPKVSISNSSSLTFCSGDSVKLTANTGSGNTYQWTLGGKDIKGETKMDLWVKASGSYGVRVDNITGCQANATAVTVSVLSKPTATIVAKSTAICSGDSMVLIAPSGSGLTYKWLYNGSAIGGATGVNFYASKAGNYRVIVSNSVCPADTSKVTALTVVTAPSTPTISYKGSLTFCSGDSIKLTSSTSTGLHYQWWQNSSVLKNDTMPDYVAKTAGSYQVSVTNSIGCSSTSTAVTVTITPPPTANITAKGATTFCSGDSVLLQADTSKTYTYKWMLGGSAISGATTDKFYAKTGGNYTVKVSSGCSATSSATLITINTSPSKPSITNVGALGFCSGDSVILLTTVGSGESAQWIKNTTDISGATSSSITVKSAGDYAVRLTNKTGCSSTSNVAKVTTGIKPTATATLGGKSTICSGDSSLISANSGTGYSYQWQLDGKDVSGATNQNHYAKAGGDYTVIVSDGGCKNTSSAVKITVNAGPTKPSISISGTVLTSTATTNNQWYRNDTLISGATNQTYTATVSGKYRVVVTDAGGCSTSSDPLGVSITAIEVSTSNFNLKIYPNPFKEMINVEYTLTEASQVQILITDITGKEIVKENLSHADAGQHTYNFNPSEFGLNSNLYIVKMIIGNTVVSKPVLHIK